MRFVVAVVLAVVVMGCGDHQELFVTVPQPAVVVIHDPAPAASVAPSTVVVDATPSEPSVVIVEQPVAPSVVTVPSEPIVVVVPTVVTNPCPSSLPPGILKQCLGNQTPAKAEKGT